MINKLRERAGWPLRRAWNWLVWSLHPQARISRRRLKEYRNFHKNQSCVIVGNGPSLKEMDLSWLKDQTSFGLNRIYLLFPELGFQTTYLVSVNRLVLEQSSREMTGVGIPLFASWQSRQQVPMNENVIYLRRKEGDSLGFSRDPSRYIWEGSTVTYVAMQLAYYMGFNSVYLIGVDHRFKTEGQPHQVVVTEYSDPNHFDPNYFGKGFRWQLPDLQRSEEAYRIAKQAFEKDGRSILDATLNGALDIFPKVDYRDHFRGKPGE